MNDVGLLSPVQVNGYKRRRDGEVINKREELQHEPELVWGSNKLKIKAPYNQINYQSGFSLVNSIAKKAEKLPSQHIKILYGNLQIWEIKRSESLAL